MNLTNLKAVLEAREARVQKQSGLLSSGGILVSFSLNIPGPVKNAALYRMVFEEGLVSLRNLPELKMTTETDGESAAGPFAFFLLRVDGTEKKGNAPGMDREAARELKRSLMRLEENTALGRLFDIDVLYPGDDGYPEKVSRTELGAAPRACLVCGDRAFTCVRTARHRVPDVLMKVIDRILDSKPVENRLFGVTEMTGAEQIALEAVRAVMYEVATTPKPGLVDAENNGAHRDMDITAFFDSAVSIAPYFRDCVRAGMRHATEPAEKLLPLLRPLGIRAEEDMYRATGGVNTHKGAVFTLGLCCAAAGMLAAGADGELLTLAGRIASSMENGSRGIRTEAIGGYPSLRASMQAVFGDAPTQEMATNANGVRLLLELMSRVDDSNAVRRKGENEAKRLRERAGEILHSGPENGPDEERLFQQMTELDRELIQENLSPGGSADLLATGYFLCLAEPLINSRKSSKI